MIFFGILILAILAIIFLSDNDDNNSGDDFKDFGINMGKGPF